MAGSQSVQHTLCPEDRVRGETIRRARGLWRAAGDGYVVVGSQDGQIRLYSERTLTRANTAIPGLGAPISAVDVTFDGKWVLATTATYLMVVLTVYKARPPGP